MKFAPDGYLSIGGALALATVGALVWPLSTVVLVPLAGLILWFYRDPDRTPECGPDGWVSPADGKVVEILEVDHPYTGPATKVGIFMDPLSVHVNRVPRSGKVEYLKYVPGKKWMAFAEKASEENERFYLGIRTDCGPAMMVQIAGFLARRIVCRSKKGQPYRRGDRYGMIKFGSKVDVYLPKGVELKVRVGQKVWAGKSCIGVCCREKTT